MKLIPVMQILNNNLDRAKDRDNRDKKEKFLKNLRLKISSP